MPLASSHGRSNLLLSAVAASCPTEASRSGTIDTKDLSAPVPAGRALRSRRRTSRPRCAAPTGGGARLGPEATIAAVAEGAADPAETRLPHRTPSASALRARRRNSRPVRGRVPRVLPSPPLLARSSSFGAGRADCSRDTRGTTAFRRRGCTGRRRRPGEVSGCVRGRPLQSRSARSTARWSARPRSASTSRSPSTGRTGVRATPIEAPRRTVARAVGCRRTSSGSSRSRRRRTLPRAQLGPRGRPANRRS